MRPLFARLSLPLGLVAVLACGRSDLGGDLGEEADGEGGSGGAGAAGGGSISSTGPGPGTGGSSTICGDGFIEAPEQCDDGNLSSADDCSAACTASYCGDGFTWQGVEQCDDGNFSGADACTANCTIAYCGDGVVWGGVEQCDDGNFFGGDACTASCTVAYCGDGIVWQGFEQCDDGNLSNADACTSSCTFAYCGDGVTWQGIEQCDDGNTSSDDGCVAGCFFAACGDGYLWSSVEQCDDGNLVSGDGCSSSCAAATCGDGFVDPGEACDLAAANADQPAFLLLQGGLSRAVRPVDRVVSAPTFYAYSSSSSHTGYEALKASRVFLFRDITTGVLSLFLHHGIDFNASGQMQPQGKAVIAFTGLPATAVVAVADDSPNELFKTSPIAATGDWSFQNNADGGVLSGLPIPGVWSINLDPTFSAAITSWAYVDGDDSLQGLALDEPVTLKAFNTPSACRLDCSIPACGDGILDGGEVCDDGNTLGGDGCSADCASLQ